MTVFGKAPARNQKSKIKNQKFSSGLTLIEVMLAVVILGIGSGVLLLATARCLAIITKSQRYSTAQRLIQQVGAEHPLTRSKVDAGVQSGTFDHGNGYRWEREIAVPEGENRKGLYTVRTRVSWSDRGRDSFEETVTWFYIPPEDEK
ncbi:MAG: prepilin-type N-terminal cleavage/methylation domain-containing protein [Kiritimatiellaceae bacterium]|nr:prepilin-type N-terminal cleavage/methylation domain-containing protein [Kiritimatiellaceae bacterium]